MPLFTAFDKWEKTGRNGQMDMGTSAAAAAALLPPPPPPATTLVKYRVR